MPEPPPAADRNDTRIRPDWQVSWLSIVSSIGLSLIVLAVITTLTVEGDFWQQVSRMRWWMPLAALSSVVLRILFGTWRLHYVAKGRLSWMGAFRAQLAWDFFSNVTPSTIGGGPVAPAYISRDSRIPFGDATSIILFAMLLDQIWFACAIVVVFVGGIYIEIIPASLGTVGDVSFALYFLLFLAWVILFGYATFVRPTLLSWLVNRTFRLFLLRRFRAQASAAMVQLCSRARLLRAQPPTFFAMGFALTILIWMSRYVLVVIVLYGFYTEVDQLLVLLRTVAMMLGALVMPTPGGAGGIEGLFALLLGPLIPASLLAPSLLVWRLLGYYIFIVLGAYLTVHQVKKSIQRRQESRESSSTADQC